jgi:hypothetical protein
MTDPDIVTELRAWGANGYMIRAANEIERLRAERDEARREVCRCLENTYVNIAEGIAQERGWDCFKENTNG